MSANARYRLEDLPEEYREQAARQITPPAVRQTRPCGVPKDAGSSSATDGTPWTGSEDLLQAACERWLKDRGIPYLHVYDSRRCNPGWPDLICMLPKGITAWIELKTAKGKLSPDQVAFAALTYNHGHYYGVARSPVQFASMIEEALNNSL